MKIIKKIKSCVRKLLLIVITLSSLQLYAQKISNEFSIYAGGGFSRFIYKSPASPALSNGFNGEIGVGFTAFFSQQCGFHFGAGISMLNLKVNVGDLYTFSPNLTDSNERIFDLYTTLSGYNEIHKTTALSFPVMFQFQTKMKQKSSWKKSQKATYYAMTGLKLQLLLQRSYDAQVTSLYNAAYYPEADNWAATQTFVGLGDFLGKDRDGKLSVGILVKYAFETGFKWHIGERLCLYTGVYLDLALNDPAKKFRKPVSDYIFVEQLTNLALLSFYNNSVLFEPGIKVRLAFIRPPKFVPCR